MREGARQVRFVGGEPGAGKSRLLAEAAVALHRDGAAVLVGTCVAELGSPYQPFVQPVEALLPGVADGSLPLADGSALDAHRIVDRLTALKGRSPTPEGNADPTREYPREVFDALLEAVRAAASQRTLVLLLEDVHWAGETALQLLTYLVEGTAELPLLVLATHRTTAPDRSGALVQHIARLYRLDGVRRIDLTPLDTEDVADYLVREGRVPRHRARTAAVVLRDRSGGNPFFLRELWRDLASRGGVSAVRAADQQAPESVRDTVETRLVGLSSDDRAVLDLAAVIGEDVDVATLAGASGLAPPDTLAAVDAAVSLGVLEQVPGSDGDLRFSHALVRQVVLDLVPPSRRASLHAGVAEVLARRHTPPSPAVVRRLAHHYANAQALGYAPQAVRYLVEAACLAGAGLAHQEAATLCERAAALEEDLDRRDELLVAAAHSHLMAGRFDRARSAAERVATRAGSRLRLRAAGAYEEASWRPGLHGARAAELLGDALRENRFDPSDSAHVRGASRLGRALAYMGMNDEAGVIAARAIDDARALGGDDVLAEVLAATLQHGLRPADAGTTLARATELSALADASGDLLHLGPAAYFRSAIAYLRGDLPGLLAAQADLDRTARTTGQQYFAYWAGCVDYARQFTSGNFASADRTAEMLLDLGETFGTDDTEGPYGVQAFMVRRETGGLERVRSLVTGDEDPATHWAPGLLALYTGLGFARPSARLLAWLLDGELPRHRTSSLWPGVLGFLAEAAVALGDARTASRLRPMLAEYAGTNLVAAGFVAVLGSADRLIGELDSLCDSGDPEASFAAALEMDTRMEAPVHRTHTLAAHVAHHRRRGSTGCGVDALAEEARTTATRLGLVRVLERLGPSGPVTASSPDGLTARESDVLRLLGAGLSNRDLAVRLRISENTAAHHVRSILMKTGCDNRTQAAVYAVSHGLLR